MVVSRPCTPQETRDKRDLAAGPQALDFHFRGSHLSLGSTGLKTIERLFLFETILERFCTQKGSVRLGDPLQVQTPEGDSGIRHTYSRLERGREGGSFLGTRERDAWLVARTVVVE